MTRRFQFSLRTLLAALSVACIWFGWKVERARNQRQAVDAIEAIGGIAQYDWQGEVASWERIGSFRLVPSDAGRLCPPALRQALGEHFFQNVTSVAFGGGGRNYRGTGRLAVFLLDPSRPLRYGDADDPEAEVERDIKAVISHLRKLPYLRTIYLQGRRPGLAPLAISYEAEEELRIALPLCRIVREEIATAPPE